MSAKVENLVGNADDISFNVNGEWIAAKPDVSVGNLLRHWEDLPSKATPHPISVRVRKGDLTFIPLKILLSVDAA